MRRLALGMAAMALLAPLGGCLDGTVDHGLFARSQAETARRVAAVTPIGTSKSETEAAMSTAGWSCSPSPQSGVSDDQGHAVHGDVVKCEAQPGFGGDFHAKHYYAFFLFRDGRLAIRDVRLLDPYI